MTAVKQAPPKPPQTIQPAMQPSAAEIELRELKLKYKKLERMIAKASAAKSPLGAKPLFTPEPAPTEFQPSSEGTPASLAKSLSFEGAAATEVPPAVAPKALPAAPAAPATAPAAPATAPATAPAPPPAMASSSASPMAEPAQPSADSAETELMDHFDLDSKDCEKGSGFSKTRNFLLGELSGVNLPNKKLYAFDSVRGQIKSSHPCQ